MTIAIIITSRNRCSDLHTTLSSLMTLNPMPHEIWVTADGCTDDTTKSITSSFPTINLITHTPGIGSVASRDIMIRRAKSDIILSLDDDSHPLAGDFLAHLPNIFISHPEAAVISFPEIRNDGHVWPPDFAPSYPGRFVAAYANGAAAMRRDIYLRTSGFPYFFVHAYEETDYAAQCHGLGYGVWLEPSLPIRHRLSETNRNQLKTDLLNARNEVWSALMRCPWPWVPLVVAFRALRQFQHALKLGWTWIAAQPSWWAQAVRGIPLCLTLRKPLPWHRYYTWMKLARHPIMDRDRWQAEMNKSC